MAHGCSFVLSDLSSLLTVAHFLWATWVICSRSLICLERSERIAHSRSFDLSKMSKWANERWANERIPSPGFCDSKYCIWKCITRRRGRIVHNNVTLKAWRERPVAIPSVQNFSIVFKFNANYGGDENCRKTATWNFILAKFCVSWKFETPCFVATLHVSYDFRQ